MAMVLQRQPDHLASECARLLHSEWFDEDGGAVDEPADDGVRHNLRVDRSRGSPLLCITPSRRVMRRERMESMMRRQ